MRRALPTLAAAALVSVLSACGPGASADSGAGSAGTPDAAATAATPVATAVAVTPVATPKTTSVTAPALTCGQIANAQLGNPTRPFNGYSDYIPLLDGMWSGEDGAMVEMQKPCGIGDLDGDGAADAVGTVLLRVAGGTGQFWSLAVWHNAAGRPVYRTLADLGDRNPVLSIAVAGQKATVVWLTRTSDAPMAVLNLKRTTVYKLSGADLVEVGHTDAPYTP
jgi:hypothetical protein